MIDPTHALAKLLRKDRRYKIDAYDFVFEALSYAHETLGMGKEQESEEDDETKPVDKAEAALQQAEASRHVTGQQLCEAIRLYALEQYGYLAKCVLNSWGVVNTGDFGEIVFNLIKIGHMRKTKHDRRADFDDVFDFETGFQKSFKIARLE